MFGWLTGRLVSMLLGGALAVVGGVALYDGVRNRAEIRARDRVITLQTQTIELSGQDLGVCHAGVATFGAKLDEQTKGIRDLADATKAADERAEKARRQNAATARDAREFAKEVLSRPLPTPDNACRESALLLRGPM